MGDYANREVGLQMRDATILFALCDKVFYFLGGIWFSQMVFAFAGLHIEIGYLVLAFASTVVIGVAWIICRSLLRRRKAFDVATINQHPNTND